MAESPLEMISVQMLSAAAAIDALARHPAIVAVIADHLRECPGCKDKRR